VEGWGRSFMSEAAEGWWSGIMQGHLWYASELRFALAVPNHKASLWKKH